MNEFPKNRYDPKQLLTLFDSSAMEECKGDFYKSLDVNGEELEVYFPSTNGTVAQQYIDKARRVLQNIKEMDNLVQDSCNNECKRTGIHKRDFELYLAYINIEEYEVALTYYGLRVNTEWNAIFRETGEGLWEKVNF